MILSLPWIFVSFLFYNAILLFANFDGELTNEAVNKLLNHPDWTISITMISGDVWKLGLGDFVLITAMLALFVEILKATQTRSLAILDHGLSVVVFIICIIEFLTVKGASTPLFFFITLLSLIDVVAGFSVGIRAARRDFNIPSAG